MALRRKRRAAGAAEVLFQPAKIDLVSVTADGGTARIYIVSDSPWTGSDQQLDSLQQKVHNYVSFAVDGQLVGSFPETAGLRWEIAIDCQAGAPDARTAAMLPQLAAAVRRYDGELIVLGA